MTEAEYLAHCIAYNRNLLKDAKGERQLNWNIVRGYADPSQLPSMHTWWPLEGDPISKPLSLTKAATADVNFRNIIQMTKDNGRR